MFAPARRWAWQRAAAFCVTARSRRLCRAGDFARRRGLATSQGFRDDASIVPYEAQGKVLPILQDISVAKRQCTPPSAPCGASTSPCRGGFEGLPPERLPCKGSCRRQPTEGCGALPCQYPSGLPQTSPAGVNARPTMQGKRAAGPGTAGGVPALGSSPRWLAAPLRRGAWRPADVCRSVPIYGRNVGRAISPAAGPCCGAGFAGRCKHRPLRSIGQGPAGLCRTFLPPGGNAPLRLRLAAHPPSGLRCPHRAACAEAHLRSATVKPAPSRFLRRRRRSTPQPLAGEALGRLLLGRLPCKGSCRRQPTEGCGALPCQYPSGLPQTSPAGDFARRGALRHRRVCGTMQASSPTKHRAKPCRVWRMFARAGEAGLPVRLKNQPHRAAHGAAGQNQFAREPPGRYTGAGGAVFAALTPRRPSP